MIFSFRKWMLSLSLMILSTLQTHTAPLAAPLKVVASFSILGDLVSQVGGPHIEVTNLVGPDADAHVFSPAAETNKAILAADIVFVNGLGLEGWMNRLIEASGYKGPVFVATEGIQPVQAVDPAISSSEKLLDPHAWHSVLNGMVYVRNISQALQKQDPSHRAFYQAREAEILARLQTLDQWVRDQFAEVPPQARKVITAHDAFQYFGQAYDVTFLAPVGMSTEEEASAWNVAKLIEQIRAEGIKAVFVENIANERLIKQISQEAKIPIGGTLYSDALSDEKGPAATYEAMLRHNVSVLISVL